MIYSEKDNIKNLKDAGCTKEQIDKFCKCSCKGSVDEQLRYLRQCRVGLMEELHESERKLDCLDYLIYKLEHEDTDNSNEK